MPPPPPPARRYSCVMTPATGCAAVIHCFLRVLPPSPTPSDRTMARSDLLVYHDCVGDLLPINKGRSCNALLIRFHRVLCDESTLSSPSPATSLTRSQRFFQSVRGSRGCHDEYAATQQLLAPDTHTSPPHRLAPTALAPLITITAAVPARAISATTTLGARPLLHQHTTTAAAAAAPAALLSLTLCQSSLCTALHSTTTHSPPAPPFRPHTIPTPALITHHTSTSSTAASNE